jgi:spore germination protein
MFFGDKIKDKENIKKTGMFAAITTAILGLFGIVITLGTFGKDLLPTLSQPFFMALKVINLFGVLERIEALFITFWVVADFVLIAYNVLIASNICKQKFNLSKRRIAVTPIVFIILILALVIANNYFSLQVIFIKYLAEISLALGLFVPIITLGVAKVGGKITSN